MTNGAISAYLNSASFSALVSMRNISVHRTITGHGAVPLCKCYVRDLRGSGKLRAAWLVTRTEPDTRASPADGRAVAKTGSDGRQSIRWIRASAELWRRSPLRPAGLPAPPVPGSEQALAFGNGESRTGPAGRA